MLLEIQLEYIQTYALMKFFKSGDYSPNPVGNSLQYNKNLITMSRDKRLESSFFSHLLTHLYVV